MRSFDETDIYIQYYGSPCGKLVLGAVGDALLLCDWYGKPCAERNKQRLERLLNAKFVIKSSPVLEQAKAELDGYFSGACKTFDILLHLVGTDFQKQVWHVLLEIPYGETRSYKDIALMINHPKGVRAVAQAIGANGISIFIPCHRVIGANRSLTGFAGGIEAKRWLLNKEQEKISVSTINR